MTDRLHPRRGPLSVLVGLVVLGLVSTAAGLRPAYADPGAGGDGEHVAGRILVSFEPGADRAAIAAHVGAQARRAVALPGTEVLEVPEARAEQTLDRLASHPAVVYAERDVVVRAQAEPNDPTWDAQWGPKRVEAATAWDTTRGDPAVVIAVLDTGVNGGHEDLDGAMVTGRNVIDDNADTNDRYGHGTSVASVTAARTNNARGLAGLCWTCAIMPIKVLSDEGTGRVSDLAKGITWAVDHGADVISMSLGATSSTRTLDSAVSYAAERDVLLVAAAGNAGGTDAFHPAAHEQVIGVAASDQADGRYHWSNHGAWVDVAAPGCNVAARHDGTYTSAFCGTSSASPVVAGAAALAFASDSTLTASDVRTAITHTAVDVGNWVAHGRVDAAATLRALPASTSDGTDSDGGTGGEGSGDGSDAPSAGEEPTDGDASQPNDNAEDAPDDGAPSDEGPPPGCPEGGVPDAGFADTAGNPHEANIDCVAWYGVAQGVGAQTYGPAQQVRRDQMASFIVRVLDTAGVDLPEPSGGLFADLLDTVHGAPISQLAELGIVQGTTADTYGPARSVRRDQMATFLVRAYEHLQGEPLDAPPSGFSDVDPANPHATNIAKASAAGFARGTSPTTYGPAQSVRRDQMASFLARVLERGAADGYVTPPTG